MGLKRTFFLALICQLLSPAISFNWANDHVLGFVKNPPANHKLNHVHITKDTEATAKLNAYLADFPRTVHPHIKKLFNHNILIKVHRDLHDSIDDQQLIIKSLAALVGKSTSLQLASQLAITITKNIHYCEKSDKEIYVSSRMVSKRAGIVPGKVIYDLIEWRTKTLKSIKTLTEKIKESLGIAFVHDYKQCIVNKNTGQNSGRGIGSIEFLDFLRSFYDYIENQEKIHPQVIKNSFNCDNRPTMVRLFNEHAQISIDGVLSTSKDKNNRFFSKNNLNCGHKSARAAAKYFLDNAYHNGPYP